MKEYYLIKIIFDFSFKYSIILKSFLNYLFHPDKGSRKIYFIIHYFLSFDHHYFQIILHQ
jgi:hypothetical protein